MFCEEPDNPKMEISCLLKGIYEIFSFISLLCSFFVVVITIRKIKMNIVDTLILQIIISEMLDEINILLGIIADSKGKLVFENYNFRMYTCYTQIYLAIFSCLWTLFASLFISIKLYDIIINKNRIFKGNNFFNKNINLITISIPLILSYILWSIHFIIRNDYLSLNNIYTNKIKKGTQMIKLVFCWFSKKLTIALACIVALLIIGNLYFSIFRGCCFLKNIKNNILEQNDESSIIIRQIKGINKIQFILFLYPIIACIIWITFFLFIFLFYFSYREQTSKGWSVAFCVFMSIRQMIYTLVYFLSQKKLRDYTKLFFTCQTCKKNKFKGEINPINNNTESNSINNEF